MKINGNLWLQDLRLDRHEGAIALFRSVEAWQRTFFDEYNRLKGWWSIEGDADVLYKAYEDLYSATEAPEQRRRLNLLIKPRGYQRRPVGRRESFVTVASGLEPLGYELLGCPMSSLSHPELWQRYAEMMTGETTAESRVSANRAFILFHRLVAEAELREFDSTSLDYFRDPLKNIWHFLYDVLGTVLRRHRTDWELLRAYEVAMRCCAPWVRRFEKRNKPFPQHGLQSLGLCEELALVGRKDLALHLLDALQPNRRFLRDARVDEAFEATAKVLQTGKKRRPQGSTHRAVENLLAYGLITDASATKRRIKIEEDSRVRREDRELELKTVKALNRDADAAGIPKFTGELTGQPDGVDANGEPLFKYVYKLPELQKSFYSALRIALLNGETPPLHGNEEYVSHFAREMVDATPLEQQPSLVDVWARLVSAYTDADSWSHFTESYLLLLTVNGRFAEVLDYLSQNHRENSYAEIRFNAYRELNLPIPGRVFLRFKSIETDSYSRSNTDVLARCMDDVVSESGSLNQLLFSQPRREEILNVDVFSVEVHHNYQYSPRETLSCKMFSVSERLKRMQPLINDLVREAMNRVREELGIPRIGEGWISETELYRSLRSAFPDHSVLQHGRPEWLKPQHLDVWIPEMKVGVEFHGLQHFVPVGFFGGEEAFKQTVVRDARKARLCAENGVSLFVVTRTAEIESLIADIRGVVVRTAHSGAQDESISGARAGS